MSFEAIQRLTELTGQLDAVRHVSAKLLKNDPGGAADELVTVLEEVSKTFLGFETVLVRYLSLRFTPSTRDQDQAELIKLEGPQVRQMAGEFRAHCKRIGVLYRSGLQDWFEAAPISSMERSELDRLFIDLEESDSNVIVPAVDELADWLMKRWRRRQNWWATVGSRMRASEFSRLVGRWHRCATRWVALSGSSATSRSSSRLRPSLTWRSSPSPLPPISG